MIRINLAKQLSSKKIRLKHGSIPTGKIMLVLILCAGGGGAYYYAPVWIPYVTPYLSELAYLAMPQERQDPVRMPLPPPVPRTDSAIIRPSTRVRTNMAENVVREILDDNMAARNLDIPYAQMSEAERINYEVLFGRNVFDMIARATPPGIYFNTLDILNFTQVNANGAGVSREMVQEIFAAFMTERGELLPRPQSRIIEDNRGTFSFEIQHRPNFGLGVRDPFQAIDVIGFRESVPHHMRTLTQLARENRVNFQSAPERVSAVREGSYLRILYRAVGLTTFGDFHNLVRALYDARIPCAISNVKMIPIRNDEVRVTAEFLFTVKP